MPDLENLAAGYVVRPIEGAESAAVLVPARVAALLARELSAVRTSVRGADQEVDAVLVALHLVGLRWAESSASGTAASASLASSVPPVGPSASRKPREPIGVELVARMLGTSERNVRARARRRSLPGHQDRPGAPWFFDRNEIEELARCRHSGSGPTRSEAA